MAQKQAIKAQTDEIWNSADGVKQWSSGLGSLTDTTLSHWMKIGYIPALCALKKALGGSLKHKTILDIGCGEGRITRLYKQLYEADIVGVDASENMYAEASKICSRYIYFLIPVRCRCGICHVRCVPSVNVMVQHVA